MSKPRAAQQSVRSSSSLTSKPRTALAIVLALLGIAWIVVYLTVAMDAAQWIPGLGAKPSDPLPWMSALKSWNFAIGFGLIFTGLMLSAHPSTPMGRGLGVVVGMLGCFLLGLVWIVLYYFLSDANVPLLSALGQWNLAVGIGFVACGFTFATHWE